MDIEEEEKMARHIDADALYDEVMHWFMTITGNPKQHTVVNECKSSFLNMIDEQPTADVAPVVHGHWIDNGDYVTTAYGCLSVCECSNCHTDVTLGEHDDFCPNCGAKMDGKKV